MQILQLTMGARGSIRMAVLVLLVLGLVGASRATQYSEADISKFQDATFRYIFFLDANKGRFPADEEELTAKLSSMEERVEYATTLNPLCRISSAQAGIFYDNPCGASMQCAASAFDDALRADWSKINPDMADLVLGSCHQKQCSVSSECPAGSTCEMNHCSITTHTLKETAACMHTDGSAGRPCFPGAICACAHEGHHFCAVVQLDAAGAPRQHCPRDVTQVFGKFVPDTNGVKEYVVIE